MSTRFDLQSIEDNCELVTEVMKILSHPLEIREVVGRRAGRFALVVAEHPG